VRLFEGACLLYCAVLGTGTGEPAAALVFGAVALAILLTMRVQKEDNR
jgi:hypothetical protein